MAEEVEKLFAGLYFTSDETSEVLLPTDPTDLPASATVNRLIGRVMPTNPIDADAFMRVFRVIWGITCLVEVSSLGEDTFLFKLSSDIDVDCVFSRTPWKFNRDLVALQRYDPSRGMPIWVRVYDLPLGWTNAHVGDLIAKKLGEPLTVDLKTEAVRLGSYLRIWVIIDSRQPLRRCMSLGTRPNGKPLLYIVKYERLPNFYFRCATMGTNTRARPGIISLVPALTSMSALIDLNTDASTSSSPNNVESAPSSTRSLKRPLPEQLDTPTWYDVKNACSILTISEVTSTSVVSAEADVQPHRPL
ncbi:hypothetical protein F3Y22_tig00006731pilonHSYRG00016 [Hibiscus syriacus]|uniref:DUF4283 domain-containing protein n=1 Tax=Hibiscus syriacus TaxID=106335 RepID=A0A6A3CGJ2_HIBSY|nr:hypothetical protein F3Y22_tig00006731pilonHSYRG00016 [Hibiscus syriacus]